MFGIGLPELLVILVVALLVFGPAKLPELARSLGRGLAELRRASTDLRQSLNEATQEPRVSPPAPKPEEAPPAPAAEGDAAKPAAATPPRDSTGG